MREGRDVRILIVEDDPKIADAVATGLRGEGFDVSVARNGREGSLRLETGRFDLLILDWMLPERDGLAVLRDVRAGGTGLPVLVVTARDAVEDRVIGLDAGADDYLVKPFAFAELLARVRALLRRSGHEEARVLRLEDLTVDTRLRRASRAEREIALTPKEYDLLVYLLRHSHQTVTRSMLITDVWGEPRRATPLDNVIDVHVAHLRRKVDEGHPRKLIHTVRGVGFVARAESE